MSNFKVGDEAIWGKDTKVVVVEWGHYFVQKAGEVAVKKQHNMKNDMHHIAHEEDLRLVTKLEQALK